MKWELEGELPPPCDCTVQGLPKWETIIRIIDQSEVSTGKVLQVDGSELGRHTTVLPLVPLNAKLSPGSGSHGRLACQGQGNHTVSLCFFQ